MKTKFLGTTLLVGALTIAAATTHRDAEAFSTGVHFTITQRALQHTVTPSFNEEAIRMVQASGYSDDYLANIPDAVIGAIGNVELQRAKNVAHYFHFDDLANPHWIERELAWHAKAFKTALANAVAAQDVRGMLIIFGIELHAVQDFYSHSNFADFDWTALVGRSVVRV